MDDRAFDLMTRFGDVHWWHRAKRELAVQLLARSECRPGPLIDVGCGTGHTVKALSTAGFEFAVGADASEYALRAAHDVVGTNMLVRSDAVHLPFRSGSFAALISMDVIEHLDDDVAAVAEFARVLRPGALAIIVVPAYEWMWSQKDDALGHQRRYSAKTLTRAVAAGGLVTQRLTYLHSWLLPIAAFANKVRRRGRTAGSDVEASFVGPRINALLSTLCRVERGISRNRRIPFGLSVVALGQRRG